MKNKTSKLIAAGVLLSVATLGTSAFAESTGVTKTQVGFSNSYIPEGPEGDLDFLWLPKTFDFKQDNTILNKTMTLNEATQVAQYVVVKDERTSNEDSAWSLSASASQLVDPTGSNHLSTSTKYKFKSNIKGYESIKGDNSEAPDEESVIGGSQARMVAPSDTSLATDSNAVKLMEADNRGANEARGKHALEMTDIKLEVPAGGVRNVIYDGQINWTLTNGI